MCPVFGSASSWPSPATIVQRECGALFVPVVRNRIACEAMCAYIGCTHRSTRRGRRVEAGCLGREFGDGCHEE